MRKKVDSRIRTLVENGVKTRNRSMFVIVGDKGRDQVVNLHYMLSKAVVKARPSVLWCYKTDLYLSSHRKKRMRQIKKMMQRGLMDPETEDPFSLFVASTNIRYTYYSETHKILGNTYGMCVLQDFEAITPNLLARTIETVEGGGIIVVLLSSMDSLSRLYSMTMDVHARFRTESHQDVTARFNERFTLSLASNPMCVVMDDELNILPLSSHIKAIAPVPARAEGEETPAEAELRELAESLRDTRPVGALVEQCRSLDQARAVVTFLDAASDRALRSTVALTAGRGRGKSAALGVAIAGALALGYSNIFVTSPSPENLRTLFEMLFKGLDALGYQEHVDYDLVESTNPAFGKAVVRVNVFRAHRQTVQYIQPQHHQKLAQAELLVIDEAAAIPLPVVKKLLGPYLVFLCSTVNGYEGTGRSLSLKLLQQLREQGAKLASSAAAAPGAPAAGGSASAPSSSSAGPRQFKEVVLGEPIRYAEGDRCERWLHELLCLDAAEHVPRLSQRLPHPSECELYYVNRDTLFSFHKASEAFLQRMMSLYVASHYKNTPNDLQLMSDAPAHHLFVLLAPVDETQNALPDIMCVVQVALEGEISRRSAQLRLSSGAAPQGDLIPWTISSQYQDSEFPGLSGARVVRIATHPELVRGGYGSRAVDLLAQYYEGKISDLDEGVGAGAAGGGGAAGRARAAAAGGAGAEGEGGLLLREERIRPRADLPPLLVSLAERRAEPLHYLGVSYGLTQDLFNFWRRRGYLPVYLRQTPSDVTGEHTCIMLRPLESAEVEGGTAWLGPFHEDFRARFLSLLAQPFRGFTPALALSILEPQLSFSDAEVTRATAAAGAGGSGGGGGGSVVHRTDGSPLSPHDLRRLQSYASNLVDHHLVGDLVPPLARAFFAGRLPATISHGQAAILLALGLQSKSLDDVEGELGLPSNQILALFNKTVRKLHALVRSSQEAAVERTLPKARAAAMEPHAQSLDDDLDDGARRVDGEAAAARARELLDPAALSQFAIAGRDEDWGEALKGQKAVPGSGYVSVKSGGSNPARLSSGKGRDRREGGKPQRRPPGGKAGGFSAAKKKAKKGGSD